MEKRIKDVRAKEKWDIIGKKENPGLALQELGEKSKCKGMRTEGVGKAWDRGDPIELELITFHKKKGLKTIHTKTRVKRLCKQLRSILNTVHCIII